jgi:hypothetical protein
MPATANLFQWRAASSRLFWKCNSKEKEMELRIRGVGNVTLEELEARFLAYMNAGAPEPVLEGTAEEQKAILELIARRGDSQMRALVDLYFKAL